MEFVAWFSHKYIMHGFLWVLHKDHHASQKKIFEKNDLFALIFAFPSIFLIFKGVTSNYDYKFYIGLGIAIYGLSYFLFHDVLFHQRFHFLKANQNRYFKAVVKAHGDHHRGKKNYGFLFMFPWKYFKDKNE
jgi:beta-carotene 3-hydroxylase